MIDSRWRSVGYEVKYGRFGTIIKGIKINVKSKLIHGQLIGEGKFGKVYELHYEGKKYAAKVLFTENPHNSIGNILKEIFMLKFASALEAGPKFSQIQKYDFVLYQDSAQFLMEYCSESSK